MSETCVQNANAKPTTTTATTILTTATTNRQQSTISSEKVEENKTENRRKKKCSETIAESGKRTEKTEQKNAFLLIYVHLASDASVNVNVNVDRDRGRDASVAANRTYSKICTCSREFAAWRFHANEPNGNIPAHSSSPSVSLSALPKKLSPETILSLCRKTKTSFELE